MKKKNVHLTSRQVKTIEDLAREHHLSFAEMLRRVIDASPLLQKELERIEVGKQILKGNE
jgi:hypothetical protein